MNSTPCPKVLVGDTINSFLGKGWRYSYSVGKYKFRCNLKFLVDLPIKITLTPDFEMFEEDFTKDRGEEGVRSIGFLNLPFPLTGCVYCT